MLFYWGNLRIITSYPEGFSGLESKLLMCPWFTIRLNLASFSSLSGWPGSIPCSLRIPKSILWPRPQTAVAWRRPPRRLCWRRRWIWLDVGTSICWYLLYEFIWIIIYLCFLLVLTMIIYDYCSDCCYIFSHCYRCLYCYIICLSCIVGSYMLLLW